MGTLLLEQGIPAEICLEELCLTEPERVRAIHDQYIGAGARVIETNTFGANAVRLERHGLESHVGEINRVAAQIAMTSARGKDVYVAGSVGPLGLTGEEAALRGIDREHCFHEQLCGLLEGGVDLMFFETFTDFEEMESAVQAWKKIGKGLALCSFACSPEGRLRSGMPLEAAIWKVRALGVGLVGVNCIDGPKATVELSRRLPAQGVIAVYPNAGFPQCIDGRRVYPFAPEEFSRSAGELVAQGARLVGGCCGTTPAHVAALAVAIAGSGVDRQRE